MWDILVFAPFSEQRDFWQNSRTNWPNAALFLKESSSSLFCNGASFGKTAKLSSQKSRCSWNFPLEAFFPMARLLAKQQDCLAKSRLILENLALHHDSFCLCRIHHSFIFGEQSIEYWLFPYAFKPCEFNHTTTLFHMCLMHQEGSPCTKSLKL